MMIDDKILEFAYLLSFRDATQRRAYPKNSDSEDQFKERKDAVFTNSKIPVRNYIEDIFNGEHPEPIKVICSLCSGENKSNGFTFGNAQKLVNMIAKYMYIGTYGDESKRELFRNCHCPMDTHMIECVNKEFPEDMINVSWSKLEYRGDAVPSEYEKFQDRIKKLAGEKYLPVEFDYVNWE